MQQWPMHVNGRYFVKESVEVSAFYVLLTSFAMWRQVVLQLVVLKGTRSGSHPGEGNVQQPSRGESGPFSPCG